MRQSVAGVRSAFSGCVAAVASHALSQDAAELARRAAGVRRGLILSCVAVSDLFSVAMGTVWLVACCLPARASVQFCCSALPEWVS